MGSIRTGDLPLRCQGQKGGQSNEGDVMTLFQTLRNSVDEKDRQTINIESLAEACRVWMRDNIIGEDEPNAVEEYVDNNVSAHIRNRFKEYQLVNLGRDKETHA